MALDALRRIPEHATATTSSLRRDWRKLTGGTPFFHGYHVSWTVVRGPLDAPTVAVAKILATPLEVWVDELAANGDGSSVARWALASALESALEARLTTDRAVLRLRVALPPFPGARCAYGMYATQLRLTEGVPDYAGPWQGHSAGDDHVLMHGTVGGVLACLRRVLTDRPLSARARFFWRLEQGTFPLAPIHITLARAASSALMDTSAGETASTIKDRTANADGAATVLDAAAILAIDASAALTSAAAAITAAASDVGEPDSAAPGVLAVLAAAAAASAAAHAASAAAAALVAAAGAVVRARAALATAPAPPVDRPSSPVECSSTTPTTARAPTRQSGASDPYSHCTWEDEEEVLAAISFERADDGQLAPPDERMDEGDQTTVPPTLQAVIAAASQGSAPAHASLAHAAGTAALVSAMMPPTPAPVLRAESLLRWNAAGWWGGDCEAGTDEHQATVASRYDALTPVLRGVDAPTYIVLNEISGSTRDSEHPRGLRAWLSKAGYGHQFYPGGSTTNQRFDGSTGATGGVLLAWLKSETTPCGKPELDPVSMTIMVDLCLLSYCANR